MARRATAVAGLLLARASVADVYHYNLDLKAYGSEDNLRYRQSGMYSKHDAPSQTPPGDGHSFIDFGTLELEVAPGFLTMAYPGAVTYVEVTSNYKGGRPTWPLHDCVRFPSCCHTCAEPKGAHTHEGHPR